ncbi:MAG: hypothetical protein AAGI23_14590 [Bacteroidota bacterium]
MSTRESGQAKPTGFPFGLASGQAIAPKGRKSLEMANSSVEHALSPSATQVHRVPNDNYS